MRNWLNNFLYSPEEDNDPGFLRVLRTVLTISLVGSLLVLAALILTNPNTQTTTILALSTITAFSAIALILTARNILWPGKILIPLLFSIVTPFIATSANGLRDSSMFAFPFIVITASLLIGRKAIAPFTVISLIGISLVAYRDLTGLRTSVIKTKPGIDDIFVYALIMVFISLALSALLSRLYSTLQKSRQNEAEQIRANADLRQLQSSLEERITERTSELDSSNQRNERRARQFESVSQVARTISSTRDLDSLLVQITAVINREFGFYHIGIFLLDTAREFAILSATNSDGGRKMLERSHRLKVGETGIVGYVTSTGRPRVALDTDADTVFFNNPDLPETRSEIALPLRVGDEIFGALDVQSTEANAFNSEDANILSTLADQVSIAIQNARQYDETRKALAESNSLSKQFIQSGWSQFTRTHKLEGIRHTGAIATLLYKKSGKDKDESLSDRNQFKAKRRGAVLSLPMKLRGVVIGSVDIHSPEKRQWDQDELDIVTAIIERSAIAMENARLLVESQKLAAKERAIGEISAKIGAQGDVDELLKTTAQELGRTLPGMEITIQLRKEEVE